MESILTSIKKLLGPTEEYDHFDPDIIMHINSVLSNLTLLGVGPAEGFAIQDEKDTWDEFIKDDPRLNHVKTYVYLRVRLVFDPPSSSAVIEAMKKEIDKLEWLLNVAAETK